MAKVELKQPVVNEIKELLTDAQSAVLVSYRGITVEQDTAMRKELREADVEYKVYKNTMIRFAIQGTEFEALADDLKGPTAIAVSKTDATAPARILAKHAKNIEVLEMKSGVVEGTFYDAEGMKAIASVPSREVLLSKLLGSLQSPITNLARVLNQIAENGGAVATEAAPAEEPIPVDNPLVDDVKVSGSTPNPAPAQPAAAPKQEAPQQQSKPVDDDLMAIFNILDRR